jgi:type I restriction enzyme S subunit
MHELQVRCPSVSVQRRIASILGSYDDLIEVNRRRTAVLEEMAQRLFQKWFVEFRYFSNSEPIAGSEPTSLPAGWTWGRLDDLLLLQRGFDLPSDKRSPGPHPVISASGVHGYHSVAKVKGPGVVTGRSGTIGEVILIQEDFWALNTTLYVSEFRRATPIFAFFVLRNLSLKDRGGGAAVPTLNRNHIHGLKTVIPSTDAIVRFGEFASPLFQLIRVYDLQQARLSASRDLLLPRLISGELSVIAAEREIEQAA